MEADKHPLMEDQSKHASIDGGSKQTSIESWSWKETFIDMCVSTPAQGAASISDYGVLVAVTHSTVHIRSVLMTLTYVTVCSVVMTSRI